MIDSYRTISAPATARITRKKSRFIGDAFPIASADEARNRVSTVRKRRHDASHHCFAYRLLGPDGPASYLEDAGEPSGSAGLPILQQIESSSLLNVLVVITRYFGGTKLGIGGLVRAYGDAARAALEATNVVEKMLRVVVSLRFPIEVNSNVMATIHRYKADVKDIAYDEHVSVHVSLPPSRVAGFRDALVEVTGNRTRVEESQ